MNHRKVCFIASVHQSPFNIRVFYKEAISLRRAGYDLSLIVQHVRDEIVEGIRIIALHRPKNRFYRFTIHTFNVLMVSLRQKAAVYHIQSPELLPVAVFLKLLTGKKIVYDVHEDFPKDIRTKEWLPSNLRIFMARAFAIIERSSCYFVDQIIAATNAIARHFPAPKTVTITNYPFRALAGHKASRSARKKSYYQLIYAGDLSAERGLKEMVEAVGLVVRPSVRLQLIGRFTDPQFKKMLQSLPSFSRVDYLEWMPFNEIVNRYREADVGVILYLPRPNHVEAMPNKLFEYMALELPIVASHFPLWKKIIEGNQCGITVDPENPGEIAQAINRLMTDGEMRLRMGRNGRRAVIDKYNWEREETKLIDAYNQLTEPVL